MTTKFTPGPWKFTITKIGVSWPGLYSIDTNILSFGFDGEEGIYIDNPNDAFLMFAAPELFEACEKLINLYGLAEIELDTEEMNFARAALAKARGKVAD